MIQAVPQGIVNKYAVPELSHPLDLYEGQLEGVVPLKRHADEVPQVVEPGEETNQMLDHHDHLVSLLVLNYLYCCKFLSPAIRV